MTGWRPFTAQSTAFLGLIVYSAALWWVSEVLVARRMDLGKVFVLGMVVGWGLVTLGLILLVVILPWQRRLNVISESQAWGSARALVNVGLAVMFMTLLAGLMGEFVTGPR